MTIFLEAAVMVHKEIFMFNGFGVQLTDLCMVHKDFLMHHNRTPF